MTDRDYFAAAALTGILARGDDMGVESRAWAAADAMLRERERTACVAQPEVQPICDRPVAGSTPAAGCGSPGDGWRWVEPGEVLREGDEFRFSDGTWGPTLEVGDSFRASRIYRRRIDALTTHDAAPAATAPTDANPLPDCVQVTAGMGTGKSQQPVMHDRENLRLLSLLADIRAAVGDPTGKLMQDDLVERCRALRLTDAERFVLREVRDIYANEDDVAFNEIAAVLDGLLERTK